MDFKTFSDSLVGSVGQCMYESMLFFVQSRCSLRKEAWPLVIPLSLCGQIELLEDRNLSDPVNFLLKIP